MKFRKLLSFFICLLLVLSLLCSCKTKNKNIEDEPKPQAKSYYEFFDTVSVIMSYKNDTS